MTNTFEKIFEQVRKEHNIIGWYGLFNSEYFLEVEERIANKMNVTLCELWDNAEYQNWVKEMEC